MVQKLILKKKAWITRTWHINYHVSEWQPLVRAGMIKVLAIELSQGLLYLQLDVLVGSWVIRVPHSVWWVAVCSWQPALLVVTAHRLGLRLQEQLLDASPEIAPSTTRWDPVRHLAYFHGKEWNFWRKPWIRRFSGVNLEGREVGRVILDDSLMTVEANWSPNAISAPFVIAIPKILKNKVIDPATSGERLPLFTEVKE